MNQTRQTQFRSALVLGMFGGAALGCSPGVEGSSSKPPVRTETQNAIVCNEPETLEEREFYVLSAMRKKLADFPELSSEVSSDPPTDCETARDFFAGYQRYLKLYPDFDSNQELGPAPADPGASDDGPLPKLTVQKISDGVPPTPDFDSFPRAPVVKISHLPSPNTGTESGWCSASFIAKNWVVTAAHCMAITRPVSIPFSQRTAADLFGYARYRVDWPGADGNLIPTATLTSDAEDVLQHPDPRFIGRTARGNDPGFTKFDFALLYFREQRYDTVLPPRAETGAAMRIAMFPPPANEAIEAAGFATGASGEQSGVLTRGTFSPPLSIVEPRGTIERDVRSPTEPTLCKGDSGGPAYKMVNIPPTPLPGEVPFEQAPTRVPVMHGVNSAGLPPEQCRVTPPDTPPDGCPLPSACSVPGDINVWTRVDGQRLFIEERMALWQHGPLFQCREGHVEGSTVNTFLECWGTPCAIDRNCAANEFCRRPAEAFADASCQACQGACGCIVGQCIPFQ